MTKAEVLKMVEDIMSSPAIKIHAENGTIKVYKNTFFGYSLALTIVNDTVDIDGIKHYIGKEERND